MRLRILWYLAILISVTACAQMQVQLKNLPIGISLLEGIEPTALQTPLWSPDGTKIVASYVIEAMPNGIFGSETRHDIALIDTDTWKTTIFSKDAGSLIAESWSPDSKSFAMFWSTGPNGAGIYEFKIDDASPSHLSKTGGMSPDWTNFVTVKSLFLEVSNADTQTVNMYIFPVEGFWEFNAWSPDMTLLTLIYQENEEDRFENIYLLNLDTGRFSQFTHDDRYFKNSPIISPNGKLIAYGMWRMTEKGIEDKLLISRLDHSCQWTMPLPDINYFAWSPDNQRMFLIGADGVYIADLNVLFGKVFSNGNDCP